MTRFDRITIVGLGLIGGSLGMAIKRRRLARVVGFSRSAATVRRAKACGAIDVGVTDLRRAVAGADLVVLATPVDAIVPTARRLARWMRPGAVLTDVGSTKGGIVAGLDRGLPRGIAFVGAHPLTGSEQRGIDAAQPDLFTGAVCVLTPTAQTSSRTLAHVRALWRGVGAQVIEMSPREHDRTLAGTSHLPHLLAYCLAQTVDANTLPRTPQSFLDTTRIAKSDPDLWDDIFVTNRAALLPAMDVFEGEWRRLRALIARSNRSALRRALGQAKRRRDALNDS